MEAFILDWLSLIIRWLHVITGIAWIGASFYFVWLDNSLEEPPEWKQKKGVKGDLWAFHGGGIYEVAKYKLAPETMPKHLHWFKWEAYSTWLSGIALMAVVYYFQASTYLVGPNSLFPHAIVAVPASVLFLFLGFALYEIAITSPLRNYPRAFAAFIVVLISGFSFLATLLFSGRAAFLHIGALMGTIMVANVYFGIMPAQRKFMASVEAGETPDEAPMLFAKLRSTHNNYFTLPVLFCMISNHYPLLYGHHLNWLVLIAIVMISAYARHFFNLRHRNIFKPQILGIAALAFLTLVILLGIDKYHQEQKLSMITVSEAEAMAIVNTHCTVCHAPQPTFPGILAPPQGMLMTSPSEISSNAQKMHTAVTSNYMPLANVTGMTNEERQTLLAWLNELSE